MRSATLTFLCLFPFIIQAQKKKTLVVLVDGIPTDVIERLRPPHLYAIAIEGAFAAAYVGGEKGGISESPTISAVGYNSMLTGTWANKHNVWDNDISKPNYAYPTFFKVAKDAKPQTTLGIFSTWEDNRTKLLGEGLAETDTLRLDIKYDGYEHDNAIFPHDSGKTYIKNIDKHVVQKAVETLQTNPPDISWVYLEFSDDMGHGYGDGIELDAAVLFEDSLVGLLHTAIKKRKITEHEDWLMIVTTDHGRTAQNGKHHGGQSERERRTWIATNTNIVNQHFHEGLAIVDIFPTVCQFMDIKIPTQIALQLDGQSFLK